MTTHEVFNQPPPLVDYDVSADAALLAGVAREGAPWAVGDLHRLGKLAGTAEPQRWADEANRHEPRLLTHDRYGNRLDEVEFHPSWHRLMEVAVSAGLAGAAWADTRPAPTSPGRRPLSLVAGRGGPLLPDLDDVRRGARAACQPRTVRALRATAHQPYL